ncbi:MAG: hypothetical protein HRU15_18795 [Planctomycetes bacterium]|nr:hypothetical protein [Planctomycetota bacterium]
MDSHNIFKGIESSASAMAAENLRMTVASENLAHAGSTKRKANGMPYARQRVHFETVMDQYGKSTGRIETEVVEKPRYIERYDPQHPDADPKTGMVVESDIDPILELTDMMIASQAYESNANAVRGLLAMHEKALRIGEG